MIKWFNRYLWIGFLNCYPADKYCFHGKKLEGIIRVMKITKTPPTWETSPFLLFLAKLDWNLSAFQTPCLSFLTSNLSSHLLTAQQRKRHQLSAAGAGAARLQAQAGFPWLSDCFRLEHEAAQASSRGTAAVPCGTRPQLPGSSLLSAFPAEAQLSLRNWQRLAAVPAEIKSFS